MTTAFARCTHCHAISRVMDESEARAGSWLAVLDRTCRCGAIIQHAPPATHCGPLLHGPLDQPGCQHHGDNGQSHRQSVRDTQEEVAVHAIPKTRSLPPRTTTINTRNTGVQHPLRLISATAL
jgi:hypothetical protein